MASFIALYGTPEDPAGFEAHYRDTHLPMAARVEGVKEVRVQRGTGTPRGGEPPYHLTAEIVFEDAAALQAALRSESFRDLGRDAADMTRRFGVEATMLLTEDF